jgi:hypothetical protein
MPESNIPRIFIAGNVVAGRSATIAAIGRMQDPAFDWLKWACQGHYELSVDLPDGRFVMRQEHRTNLVYDVIDDADRDPSYRAQRDFVAVTDGIVFVADSQDARAEANVWFLRRLEDVLVRLGRSPHDVPMVFALNKRDLPRALPVEELVRALQWPRCVHVPTVAKTGEGVDDVVRAMIGLTRTARPYR